jgi:hypothetical protein
MLRAVLIAVFSLALLIAAVLGFGLFETAVTGSEPAQKEECNLLAGPCVWSDDNGRWSIELLPPADTSDSREYVLTVTTASAPDRFLAVLRGESMYMGEYPVPLVQSDRNGHTYAARFSSPVCSTGGRMVWRIDLQQGQNAIDNIPVRMVFQADHQ